MPPTPRTCAQMAMDCDGVDDEITHVHNRTLTAVKTLMENGGGDLLPQPEMMAVTEADTMVATVTTGTGEIATMAVTATTGTEETGAAEAFPITSLLEIGAGIETVGGMEASPEGTGTEERGAGRQMPMT